MPVADADAIRRAVDSPIGENLTCPCAVARIGDPARYKRVASLCESCDQRSRPQKKHTSKATEACVLHAMRKNGRSLRQRHTMDYALAAMSQMQLYCEAHPGSPSAVRRPRLFVRGELWIALLGPTVEEGIVGIGATVTGALRAFDAQYLAGLGPRPETIDHPPQPSAASVAV